MILWRNEWENMKTDQNWEKNRFDEDKITKNIKTT